MIRTAAALFALLAAVPAAAGCQTVTEVVADLRASLPPQAFVAEVSASVVPTVLAWLEAEGLPHRADRVVQVAGPNGIALLLVVGERACDGAVAVQLAFPQAIALAGLVRRFRGLMGYGMEREA